MKSRILYFFIFLFALAACNPATPVSTEDPTAVPSTPEPTLEPEIPTVTLDWLTSFPLQTILLQHDYEPTFFRPESFYEFGRVPYFTLFADGTAIYVDEGQTYKDQQVMTIQLTPEETLALVQQIFDFGFTRLVSHISECRDMGNGMQECVADASFTILRAQLPDGEYREIKIFHNFANDEEAFTQITQLLSEYSHSDAQPLVPRGATLFVSLRNDVTGVETMPWPLHPDILNTLQFNEMDITAIPLTDIALNDFLTVVDRNTGDFFVEHEGRFYGTFLVPWLPGDDYAAEIEQTFRQPGQTGTPNTFPSRFSTCWILEPPLLKPLRLAYIMDGDVWVWDEGTEPISLTGTGDITSARLSPSGSVVLYTRQLEDTAELWASNPDGSSPRLLAKEGLNGSVEIGSFSFDEALVTFTDSRPSMGGELWVANIDGSGARLLVSQEDLMSIIQEPLANFAHPAGVTWIPNTYTLTYDAAPGFIEDGIYIYVQRQNWVVDALTGAKGVLFPAGEGGQISYSPDGTTMMITTPDSLRFMNVEAKDLHEAGVEYFATGFGEYYIYPPLAWLPDSQAILIAQPVDDSGAHNPDVKVNIFQVPVDGSPAMKILELTGFIADFSFSPDLTKVAYWRPTQPQSNERELHIVALDGSEHIIYETADTLEFLGWSPFGQNFVYGIWSEQRAFIGDVCGEPVPLQIDGYPGYVRWLDGVRFLFERWAEDNNRLEVYLDSWFGETVLKLNLDEGSWYDFVLLDE